MENSVEVTEQVLISYIEGAIKKVNGVAISKKKKAIKITSIENSKVFDIFLEVNYGIIIPEIAKIVQKSIKEEISLLTGIVVKEVNIVVDSLNIDSLIEK